MTFVKFAGDHNQVSDDDAPTNPPHLNLTPIIHE